jgi:hypothetical protein
MVFGVNSLMPKIGLRVNVDEKKKESYRFRLPLLAEQSCGNAHDRNDGERRRNSGVIDASLIYEEKAFW